MPFGRTSVPTLLQIMTGKFPTREKLLSACGTHRLPMDFAGAAQAVARQLEQSAIWYGDRCSWTGDDFRQINDQWRLVHRSVDPYLYAGAAGIALFLSWCARNPQCQEIRRTALGAMRHSLHVARTHNVADIPLGLYDGATGLALAACSIGKRLQETAIARQGVELAESICDRLRAGREQLPLDIVSGLAGVLVGLLQLGRLHKTPAYNPLCVQLADQLVARARATSYGLYWSDVDMLNTDIGLCGMAHGASGMAYALLEAGELTRHDGYFVVAQEAMRYERSWFNRMQSNWPDNREPEGPENTDTSSRLSFPVYWCHGAAGIGLARLHAYHLTGNPRMAAEATAALQVAARLARPLVSKAMTSRNFPGDVNMSICHGLGSIIELFLYAAQVFKNREFIRRARDIGVFACRLNAEEAGRWRCGLHGGGEAPGLMMGLAGIGTVFLHLAAPGQIPIVGLMNMESSLGYG